jgi:hypothetical protein
MLAEAQIEGLTVKLNAEFDLGPTIPCRASFLQPTAGLALKNIGSREKTNLFERVGIFEYISQERSLGGDQNLIAIEKQKKSFIRIAWLEYAL